MVYRPYPRRLEYLTISRCHCKGSIFSSVILRPRVLVRSGALPTELTGQRLFCSHLGKLQPSGSPCPTDEWTLFVRHLPGQFH